MPIVRLYPGDIAPHKGVYVLVGHFGENTDLVITREAGERLPDVTLASELGPFWFVHVSEAHEATAAA
jgi:hypothetical protein